jgi:hypothetical protein
MTMLREPYSKVAEESGASAQLMKIESCNSGSR